jgi:hypothetical protein
MPFTRKTINAFEMIGRTATCEIEPSGPGLRAFVGVYPPQPKAHSRKWVVRRFELPEQLVAKYFGTEDLLNSQKIDLDSMGEVEDLLARWGIDTDSLDASWNNDYPL